VKRYPGIAEYNQSAQNPATAFTDPELAAGSLATSGLGLPIVLGGGFALTYTVSLKARKFAVRCFHRYVPDLKQRYAQISDAIGALRSKHFVSFEYQREGVRVRSVLYPVVKMAWAEGPTLGLFLEDNYDNAAAMRSLLSSFHELARFLADRGIAHGDLENGNMVVRNGSLTLIDYDGMYVPAMPLGNGNELGHTHFQHPGRRPDHFGPRIDDFSFILIDLSLDAIARDQSLYERFCNGDNILFQKSDFEKPGASPLFRELRRMRPLADKVEDFASICKRPIEQVPSLEAFLARHATPGRAAVAQTAPGVPAGARPAGMSNLDYIRSSLGRGTPGPTPSLSRLAVSNAAAGRSRVPQSNRIDNRTSDWVSWVKVFMVMLILWAILAYF
jgi:hypothetical protein